MSDYFIFYAEANVVCVIIFGIMLARDVISLDRQEKQIKYDHALVAMMAYFVSDTIWAGVLYGALPKNALFVALINFSNYVIMAAVAYTWLNYAMAVEKVPHRERRINKFAVIFPFLVTTVLLVVIYLAAPSALIVEDKPTNLYYALQTIVPIIYIVAVLVYTIRKAKNEVNFIERKKHIYVGAFPLMIVFGGLFQVFVLTDVPVFCFSCTIVMLIFYIQSIEKRISLDPLTGLNNRGQLMRYAYQEINGRKDGRRTFVVMIDINDFKSVNDTYGHNEGDRALTIVADSLRSCFENSSNPFFLARYGGDEFVLIIHAPNEEDVNLAAESIRNRICFKCSAEDTPYTLSVGIGYDEFLGENDSFQKCIQRADHKLYVDKEYCKLNNKSTVCR